MVKELVRHVPRLHLLRFPGYAPELNPDEGVWKLAKGMLATTQYARNSRGAFSSSRMTVRARLSLRQSGRLAP
jgi:transposase